MLGHLLCVSGPDFNLSGFTLSVVTAMPASWNGGGVTERVEHIDECDRKLEVAGKDDGGSGQGTSMIEEMVEEASSGIGWRGRRISAVEGLSIKTLFGIEIA